MHYSASRRKFLVGGLGVLLLSGMFLMPVAAQADEESPAVGETTGAEVRQDAVCDAKGRVKLVKRPDGGFAEYFYHPTLDKISAVVTNKVSTVYTYNRSGDLIRVYNSRGQLVRLEYDRHRHISRMLQTNEAEPGERRDLSFRYNAAGKPIVIRMAGKGEIRVEYDASGEIGKVESKQGAKMALGVTQAFQTLLQMVKPGCED